MSTSQAPSPETKRSIGASVKELYGQNNWKRRRRVLYTLLAFHMLMIGYLVFWAPDDALRQNLAVALTGSLASLALGYFGFPVLDDNNKRNNLAAHTEEDRSGE